MSKNVTKKAKKVPHLVVAGSIAQYIDDPLFTPREAATYLRIGITSLQDMRTRGGGPMFTCPVPRRPLYRKSALDAFLAKRTAA
jgi:hypothetical protein